MFLHSEALVVTGDYKLAQLKSAGAGEWERGVVIPGLSASGVNIPALPGFDVWPVLPPSSPADPTRWARGVEQQRAIYN